ncbi:hypothetical protein Tco_1334525, partial [Tanacetum coccineum]
NEEDLEDSSKQGRKIANIDQDSDISLVHHDADIQRRYEDISTVELNISTAKPVTTAGVSTTEPDISTTNVPVSTAGAEANTAIERQSEPEQTTTKLKQRQERAGLEAAIRLQEQLNEEESQRIVRDTEIAQRLQEEIDTAKRQRMAQRLQAEEKERYSKVDKARLLVELINERKRVFAQQRAEQRRNKPMTQAQQRTYICNYIKHMGSYTLQQLKKLSFDKIKDLFETTIKRVKDFVPMESDRLVPKIAAGSSKRDAKEELNQESSKKQKTEDESEPTEALKDKESDELSQEHLQQLMIIVPEVGMNVEAVQTKYPIIDWEVYSKDTMKYWKIIRVGDHTEVYQIFEDMLKNFDRDDLVKLWELVKERFSLTEPTHDKERALWVELKILFEPNEDDTLWKLQRYMHDPLTWRLYDTCGVHHVSTDRGHDIFMLVEKDYPLTRGLLTLMLCNKL